jgi:hypothetical protein
MTTRILLSPPAGGKTNYCIERILAVLQERPLTSVWVVVPDRLQAYAFRRRLAVAGGEIGAHVGTFGDLYQEILREAKGSIPLASEQVVHRMLQTVIQSLHETGELGYYAPLTLMPGFLRVVRQAIAELKLARIWPDSFMDEASGRSKGFIVPIRKLWGYWAGRIRRG